MESQLSPIAAHEQTLGAIFSDSYAFEIPPYQRPYAWEDTQASELLTDLLDAMDNRQESGGVYFLGSIVLIKTPNSARSQVVDGQQRLTTLTILLSVLRDLTSDPETKIERKVYVHQKASADKGTQERHRLLLREEDQTFFFKHVQNADATAFVPDPKTQEGSKQRIAENTKLLRAKLEAMDEGRRNQLVQFMLQSCYLVVVAVPTPDAARRIFTVLNARGLDLTPTDILKADLLQRAGPAKEVGLAKRWEALELALGRDKFVELFGHIRMMYQREKPRTALEAGFPVYVPPFKGDAETFISDVLDPVSEAQEMLGDRQRLEEHFGLAAARSVRSLDRIDNKDWLPPALLRLWRRKDGDAADVAQFLIDLERLAYYLFLVRAEVNARMARFASVMNETDAVPGAEVKGGGLALTPEEQREFVLALSGPIYRKSRVCKPVLQRLDESLSSGGATYDKLISIEHVLPQTVDEDSAWAAIFPDVEERGDWTHKLANLVLLTCRINTKASSWDFDRKKREYFDSGDGSVPFPITQGVLATETWSPAHLKARQEKMLFALRKTWRLDDPLPPAQTAEIIAS